MSRRLDDLVPELEVKAKTIKQECANNGVDLLIYCTLRTLEEQARLYRQSRTTATVKVEVDRLNNKGFDFLADVLWNVGPVPGKLGKHVTHVSPGSSWHNFGMAFDAAPLVSGDCMWNTRHSHWNIYGEIASSKGLIWGGRWTTFKDYPHVQLNNKKNPIRTFTPDQLRQILKANGLIYE